MDFEETVAHIESLVRGWMGNVLRDAEGSGQYIGEAVFAQALSNILEDLDGMMDSDVEEFITGVLDEDE